MESKANERQVAGTHYQNAGAQQHWDLVLDTSMGYFEGQITKYVVRWRKKNGLQDLEKALHFLQKLDESRGSVGRIFGTHAFDQTSNKVLKFAIDNSLSQMESDVLWYITLWRTKEDLAKAKSLILSLMEARPVPVSDSNKHAERAGEAE